MVLSFRRYIGFFVPGLLVWSLAAMPSQAVPQSFAATGVGQIPDSMICGSAGIPLALSFNVTRMGAVDRCPRHPQPDPCPHLCGRPDGNPAATRRFSVRHPVRPRWFDHGQQCWQRRVNGRLLYLRRPFGQHRQYLGGRKRRRAGTEWYLRGHAAGPSRDHASGNGTNDISICRSQCGADQRHLDAQYHRPLHLRRGRHLAGNVATRQCPPAQEFTVNPLQLNFDVVDVTELTLRAFRVTAAASNTRTSISRPPIAVSVALTPGSSRGCSAMSHWRRAPACSCRWRSARHHSATRRRS